MYALGLEFGSAAQLSKRSGSVLNCLWGNALKRSPGIIRKSKVSYPGPGFLSSATWPPLPKKHYNGLNQTKHTLNVQVLSTNPHLNTLLVTFFVLIVHFHQIIVLDTGLCIFSINMFLSGFFQQNLYATGVPQRFLNIVVLHVYDMYSFRKKCLTVFNSMVTINPFSCAE